MTPRYDAVVVGGGVVGLAIAWELVRSGRDVRLVDPAPASGATYAAAGMITPLSEHRPTEPALHTLALASTSRYPAFLAGLRGGELCGFEEAETLLLAVDDADRGALELLVGHSPAPIEPVTLREARRREPLLGPKATMARWITEHRIDPRALADRLRAALGDRIERQRAQGILHEDPEDPTSPVTGVRLADGTVLGSDRVVVANALGARDLDGMPFVPALRPVHGDILRLGVPSHLAPFLTSTVRALVRGASVYLVPRQDGTLVIGATQREHGHHAHGGPAHGDPAHGDDAHGGRGVSAGGVYELLRDASAVVPAVAELTLLEATARARPTTPDNAPLLGEAGPGLILATGFGRHGVLLVPAAADAVRTLLDGVPSPQLTPFRPDRFADRPIPLEVS